jgi:hypothetical protein
MYHSFSPEPFDFDQLDVVNMLRDDSSNGAQQDTDPAGDTAAPMEIVHLEELDPLQVNGHQGPHPAIGVGKAPGELADVNSLETNGTGLKQPEPCSVDIDFSTATDREIIDHFRALAEHRKDKEEVPPKFDDDLAHLEPWKLQVNKRTYYRATNMLDLDEKTLDAGCWKEAEFMGIHRSGPCGEKMPLMGLSRILEFYEKDGTKTEWRMIECIWVRVSDGHMLLEV